MLLGRKPSLSRSREHAFSLVEIMVVVVIIGLLAALAVPTYRHITMRAKATAIATDFRAFSAVLLNYNLTKGAWPSSAPPGVIPPEVADAMQSNFTRPSPIGGYYEFAYKSAANSNSGQPITASIAIVTANGSAVTDDLDLVNMIYATMNDQQGNIQLSPTYNLVCIIEQ